LKNEELGSVSWKQPLQMGNMVIEVEDRKLLPDLGFMKWGISKR
jgi:hypothetical protein